MDVATIAAARLSGGERIAIIGVTMATAKAMAETIASVAGDTKQYRTNGQERITHPSGGQLIIMSARTAHRLRGYSISYAVLDDHRPLFEEAFMMNLAPAFGTHSDPRISVIG